MSSLRVFLLPLAMLIAAPQPADARPREQGRTWENAKRGDIMPLPVIEGRVVPRMRGATYLGPEMAGEGVYRLKFMRAGRVIWVDVDARTGRVLQVIE